MSQVLPSAAAWRVAKLKERGLYEVVERHAREHHVPVADVCGEGKTASLVAARRAVWRELRATTQMSTTELGAIFGRDHSTVIDALAKTRTEKAAIDARGKLRVI